MGNPFLGEIRMFGGNFAPTGWALCAGQLLAIADADNTALFNLIGTTYGGDGQDTFQLPDLRGRVPVHVGQGTGLSSHTLAETGGVESVTLTVNQIPAHTHAVQARAGAGTSDRPDGRVWAAPSEPSAKLYASGAPDASMNQALIKAVGGSQPHENMSPFLAINFIICLSGVFPAP
jgi:microcystin-dependent protein